MHTTVCKSSGVAVEIHFGSFANEELIGFISCSVNTCQKGRALERVTKQSRGVVIAEEL